MCHYNLVFLRREKLINQGFKMNNFEKVETNVKTDAQDLYEKAQDKASSIYSDIKNKTESASQQVKETVSDIYEEGKKNRD